MNTYSKAIAMNVIQKSSNGLTLMPIETKLLADRKLFIEGEINQASALEFVKALIFLIKEDKDTPIDIIINSTGGEINGAGLMMYDAICSCPTPLRMICTGVAYSMAALLFVSGPKGSRLMLEHAELMLHEPLINNRIGGNCSSIKSISDSLLDTRRKLNKLLVQHSGRTEAEIEQATSYDHFYTPSEAIEFGLADCIVDFKSIMEG